MASTSALHLVRADTFAGIPELIEQRNLSVERVLSRADLPLEIFHGRPRYIPLAAAAGFLESAGREAGEEWFAAQMAHALGPRSLLEFGDTVLASPTICALVEASSRHIASHTQGAEIWSTARGELVYWSYRLPRSVRFGRDVGHQFSVGMMVSVLRQVLGEAWVPDTVYFEQRRPSDLTLAHMLFGPNLHFEADANGIAFDRRFLARPIARNGALGVLDYDLLVMAMESNAPAQEFDLALEQVIASALSAGYPWIEWTARLCGLSVRTLQRRISQAGLSYSALVERVRLKMAQQLLGEPDLKVITIALDLGYSDPANFTHAFRRWTGVSPMAYRREVLAVP